MDNDLVEALLNEDESSTLDFKRQQYPFVGANAQQKSELLKDVLAFVNAWRRTEAYILVGVEEAKAAKSRVVGVDTHLDEAALQQFINSKTNRPVTFSYRVAFIEGKGIGVIEIPLQERPVFLKKRYGGLEKDTVYIRRGSSTDTANPDEIARMGAADVAGEPPVLDLQFADVEAYVELGHEIELESVLIELPDESQIPLLANSGYYMSGLASNYYANTSYYRDFARHLSWSSFLRPIGFVLKNLGSTLVANTHLEIAKSKEEGLVIIGASSYPSKPKYRRSLADLADELPSLFGDPVTVAYRGYKWHISTELGSVQPKAVAWSDVFFIGRKESGAVEFEAVVYADNLPTPLAVPLTITICAKRRPVSVEELIRTADEHRQ
jgi:hypothetical protein